MVLVVDVVVVAVVEVVVVEVVLVTVVVFVVEYVVVLVVVAVVVAVVAGHRMDSPRGPCRPVMTSSQSLPSKLERCILPVQRSDQ